MRLLVGQSGVGKPAALGYTLPHQTV